MTAARVIARGWAVGVAFAISLVAPERGWAASHGWPGSNGFRLAERVRFDANVDPTRLRLGGLSSDGRWAIAALPPPRGSAGSVHVFRSPDASGESWTQEARFDVGPSLPVQVELDAAAQTALVLARRHPAETEGEDSAVVYRRDGGGSWVEDERLARGDGSPDASLERSALSADGRTVAVTSKSCGCVHVFTRGRDGQHDAITLAVPDVALGVDLSANGDLMVVAAGVGARVFRRDEESWIEEAYLPGRDEWGVTELIISGDGNAVLMAQQEVAYAGIAAERVVAFTSVASSWTGPQTLEREGTPIAADTVSVTADGHTAFVTGGGALSFFRYQNEEFVYEGELESPLAPAGEGFIPGLAISSDGRRVVARFSTGELYAFEARDSTVPPPLLSSAGCAAAAPSSGAEPSLLWWIMVIVGAARVRWRGPVDRAG
ncbi:MAG: hypothetical protein AAGA56_23020 [Myxococcota bacterium]